MIFSYNWLQQYVDGKLPDPEKLADLLSKHSFEVESVKKKGNDFILDIDVRPNRAGDCLSHLGIARECAIVSNLKFKENDVKLEEDANIKAKDYVKVEIKEKDCLRYTARVLTDVKIEESPDWLKEKLNVCGLQSINNIVDAVNYVMLETGQPLHAFDLDKIEKKKIVVRFAKNNEQIITLDDHDLKLNNDILVISDDSGPLAIAGIKGGRRSGVDQDTKTIVLESANFKSKVIRNASRFLKLKTDASFRFEHGIDVNLTEKAINRASQLIQEITGCRIASGIVDHYPREILSRVVGLKTEKVKSLLGIEISQKEIINILNDLGFELLEEMEGAIKIKVPTSRIDVSLPEDLIEEIGRIYGYENIPTVFPKATLTAPKENSILFWEDFAKDVLVEVGFSEVYNYSFINQNQSEIFDYKKSHLFELKNPLSQNQKYLAPSLIPNLLKNARDNFRYFDSINIFEIGRVFKKPEEKRRFSGLMARKNKEETFYTLKGSIDFLFEKMGITDYYYDDYKPLDEEGGSVVWSLGKSAGIKVNNKEIGFLGHVSDNILKKLGIDGSVTMFDIDFDKLEKLTNEEHSYQPVCPYPSAVRDISILVPEEVKVIDVLNIINRTGGEVVSDVDLFDIYENDKERKKSLAFHIIYQAEDRTLSSEEIDVLQKKIIKSLENNLNWEVRK